MASENDDTVSAIRKFKKRIERLNDFGGAKMLADVEGDFCRDYVKERGNKGGARRDLEDLRAAINLHASEGFHRGIVKVKLPAKGEARDRWLDRSEAAKFIWACWRYREIQTISRGAMKGQKIQTEKRPLQHIARFILIGLYSGTRAGAIAAASPIPAIGRAFVDLENGIYYRRAKTNKRQPSVPIAPRLLAHLRRWSHTGIAKTHFVEWQSKRIAPAPIGRVTFACRSFRVPSHYTPRLRKRRSASISGTRTPAIASPISRSTRRPAMRLKQPASSRAIRSTRTPTSRSGKKSFALESTRTIEIDEFVHQDDIDSRYLIRPYYLVPDGKVGYDSIRCDPCDDCEDGDGRNRSSRSYEPRARRYSLPVRCFRTSQRFASQVPTHLSAVHRVCRLWDLSHLRPDDECTARSAALLGHC